MDENCCDKCHVSCGLLHNSGDEEKREDAEMRKLGLPVSAWENNKPFIRNAFKNVKPVKRYWVLMQLLPGLCTYWHFWLAGKQARTQVKAGQTGRCSSAQPAQVTAGKMAFCPCRQLWALIHSPWRLIFKMKTIYIKSLDCSKYHCLWAGILT